MDNQWVCPSCRESIDGDFDVCWRCQAERPGVPSATRAPEAEAGAQSTPSPFDASEPPPQENESILMRYQDGYRAAKTHQRVRPSLQSCRYKFRSSDLSWLRTCNVHIGFCSCQRAGLRIDCGFCWLGGRRLSAQGQIVKATLDTAVNSSPFLSNEERAKIMSLS